ncbi:MAG: hypothetical protein VX455_02915 [Candidatus Neomarinimicrobiota bacterium]|jgi:hypothetical protein|nr:hypothetical protein [Candidatus Neomarinimicrobiota bacterium]|tara:strand:- start:68 stop:442 length:375 start_codon:yes stop_codon:yes gene_type:complete
MKKFYNHLEEIMNKVDIRSLMIGVLGTILFFVLIGATEDGNLGDIVVNSITIQDDGHGGFITAFNQDQKRTLYLGTGKEQNGYVQTYNKYEQPTSYIGSNRDMDGVLVLNDRYGALGYTRSGKH